MRNRLADLGRRVPDPNLYRSPQGDGITGPYAPLHRQAAFGGD